MTGITGKSKERLGKIALYVTADILIILFSLAAGIIIWRQGVIPGANVIGILDTDWAWFRYITPAAILINIAVNTAFRLYGNLWKYASIDEVIKIFLCSAVVFIIIFLYDWFIVAPLGFIDISRRMYFIAWAVNSFLSAFSRFGYRMVKRMFIMLGHAITSKSGCRRVMVVGASFAGYGAVKAMRTNPIRDRVPVIIVDPDPVKNNTSLLGCRVVSGLEQIPDLAVRYEIDEIIIAMPAGAPRELRMALDICSRTGCRLKIMPPVSDVTDARAVFTNLRDVNISDLLYREEVSLDTSEVSGYIQGKVVLVTGGGGTIGSELCRQIAPLRPKKLIMLELYENNAFELMCELRELYKNEPEISLLIGSVRDMPRLCEVFDKERPDVVFHAAAHKHVMVIEENMSEAVKNNILGTLKTAAAAYLYNAERFVLISSDKAVNPANAYGATKRAAELVIQGMAAGFMFDPGLYGGAGPDLRNLSSGRTRYMTVRFGNVLGASGSVLHLFMRRINSGGPVIITGPPDMTRFYMTIPEACRLVLSAAGLNESGKILVLDMGEPVVIADLARKMISLCGYVPDKDIKIIHTNFRPGDKPEEELLLEEEKQGMEKTLGGKVFIAAPVGVDYNVLNGQLMRLTEAAENGGDIKGLLKEIVPEYTD